MKSTPILQNIPERAQVVSPTRLAKLPPIASLASDEHPSSTHLQAASSELKDAMKHLLSEAQSAEDRVQRAMEALWQRMLEILQQKVHELERELSSAREGHSATSERLTLVLAQEAALVQQNARMSVELAAGDNARKRLETELDSLRTQLATREAEIADTKDELKSAQAKQKTDSKSLQKELDEKSRMLLEYQQKVSKMTEKVQKLSKQLTSEKAASEELQKSTSVQMSQQTSENRKLLLEISKLKAQLTSSCSALAAAKDEAKKLETQLKGSQKSHEAAITKLQKQHSVVVQSLEKKIAALEKELEALRSRHQGEIGKPSSIRQCI